MTYLPVPATVQRSKGIDTTTATFATGAGTAFTLTTPSPHATAYALWVIGTPTRITIQKAGYYIAIARAMMANQTAGRTLVVHVYKNGTTVANSGSGSQSENVNVYGITAYTVPTLMAVGDYFEGFGLATGAGVELDTSQQWLEVMFIPTEAYPG